jgi:hypothetical protein
MPHTPLSNARARSFTLRGVVTALWSIGLVVILGGAVIGAAIRTSAHEGESERRQRVDPGRLDSWGTAESGLDTVVGYVAGVEAARRWYSDTIMHDHWLRIGRCEQPGIGYGGVNWYADGWSAVGHFQGGLGISTGMWREHSAGFPSSALLATPAEQMAVATRIYEHYGPGAWACKA